MVEIAALAVSAAALGYGVYSGEKGRQTQRRAIRTQEAAQNEAKQAALAGQVRDQQRLAQANQKQPDVESLLSLEQQPSALSASMLTGGGGKKGGRNRPTLLGEV